GGFVPIGPLVGVLAGGAAAWAVARSGLPGQTIASAATAGMVGTLVGSVIDQRSPMWAYAGIGVAMGLAGPVAAMVLHGDRVVEAVFSGRVAALARPSGMDWLAGVLMGVPVGDAWAASMLERKAGHGAGDASVKRA
ncbi:MAG TPA: hypothetical protein DEB06_05775, partial [Phycisphaerales bacterium]|nr:hypothetical protein [Phycisphaerales bacterium]